MPFEFQEFSEKSIDFLKDSNYFINIAEGAVRSGKTILVIFRFIKEIITYDGINYAIAGRTTESSQKCYSSIFKNS